MQLKLPAGRRGRLLKRSPAALAAGVFALSGASSFGVSFDAGEVSGSFDTTLSIGGIWRMEQRADNIVGTANGGNAFSVNYDDGTLNFNRGLASSVAKVTSELEVNYKNFGFFGRGTFFYDFELEDDDRLRTPLSDGALRRSGSDGDILDAMFYWRFSIGDMPAEFRIGEQVVNWGESTFIQGGNNVINHFNVSALRIPGAELREALLAQDLVWFSLSPTENLSMEFVYQYDWDDTEPEGVGTFFSTNDFAVDGGTHVRLGFGDTPDFPNPQFSDPTRPFNAIPRGGFDAPDDGGQFGLALRYYAEDFNNGTEFGLYYYRYHSRLPLLSARSGSAAGLVAAASIGAGVGAGGAADIAGAAGLSFLALDPGNFDAAIAAGQAAANGGVPDFAAAGIAAAAITGQSVAAVAGAYATDAFGATAEYFTSFPEDITNIGLSFNTTVGQVAVQGEYSLKLDLPLQVDDLELLFAGLSSLRDPFAQFGQLGSFSINSISPQFNENAPPGTVINGFRRQDVSQFQVTATRLFGPMFGASQGALVAEAAVVHVHRMPDQSEIRFDAPGTFVSGNEALADLGHPGKPFLGEEFFPDATSYGYRLLGLLEYNNVIGPINLIPNFSYQHDVEGISPGPGGNFIEGRKALTFGVRASYLANWNASLSWTQFYGGGSQNLLRDRDFIGANLTYTF
ncbi:MAG: DUF1302 domain-containing protein [Gammaproteobacteria bacterium]